MTDHADTRQTDHMTWGRLDQTAPWNELRSAREIVAWINELGGRARYDRYEPASGNRFGPRILIASSGGERLAAFSGDTVHDTGEWFWVKRTSLSDYRLRLFRIERAS